MLLSLRFTETPSCRRPALSRDMLPSWRKTRSSKLMRSLRSLYQASMEVTMSLFPLRWRHLRSSCFGAPEDAGRVCSCSGLLQLPGQPLSAHSPHAGLALDAALAAAPLHLAPCQPFPADSAPLPACRDSLCQPLALLRAELS